MTEEEAGSRRLKMAIQCETIGGERGDYLYDPATGISQAVSPVFGGLVALLAWCATFGWGQVGWGLDAEYAQAKQAGV